MKSGITHGVSMGLSVSGALGEFLSPAEARRRRGMMGKYDAIFHVKKGKNNFVLKVTGEIICFVIYI